MSDLDKLILRDPRRNKGTAFTVEERQKYGLTGLLPDVVETMETQIKRVHIQLDNFERPIQKYIYLTGLLDSNETLFFKTIISEPAKYLPLVYTPLLVKHVSGLVILRGRQEHYLSLLNKRIILSSFLRTGRLKMFALQLLPMGKEYWDWAILGSAESVSLLAN